MPKAHVLSTALRAINLKPGVQGPDGTFYYRDMAKPARIVLEVTVHDPAKAGHTHPVSAHYQAYYKSEFLFVHSNVWLQYSVRYHEPPKPVIIPGGAQVWQFKLVFEVKTSTEVGLDTFYLGGNNLSWPTEHRKKDMAVEKRIEDASELVWTQDGTRYRYDLHPQRTFLEFRLKNMTTQQAVPLLGYLATRFRKTSYWYAPYTDNYYDTVFDQDALTMTASESSVWETERMRFVW